ncbi:MAG: hypothetical protein IKO76_06575 [Butyrivibrio sp.]|nr:hypothetical protein [Butyrivibrio sp.]
MDSKNKSELESMKQAISEYVVKTLTEEQDTEKISLAATLIYGYSELTKLENPSAE